MATNVFEVFAKISLDSSGFEKGLGNAKSGLSSFGNVMKSGFATLAKVGAAGFAASTAAITAFSKSAVDAGKSFDSSMSQVAATMGVTVDQISELRDYAQEMGATTAFSATQAADALNYMALAGYDAQTSMEMLPNVLNLAAAGGMELATASDMITDSQSALGLSLEETSELVNKMAQASSKSNTSVSQLGDAILTVGGTAKNLKGSTTELTTILGILADNGVKGAEGGTALRNILNSLTAPTDKAAILMSDLGVSVFDTEGNMRSLNDVFLELNNAMSSMSQQERMNVISTIFNARDMKSAEALLANVGDRYEELSGYIEDAAGAAEAMAGTQLDNLTGDITLFQSALEGAQIAVSDKLTPTLRQFVKFGGDSIGKLTTAFKEDGVDGALAAFDEIIDGGFELLDDVAPKFLETGALLMGKLTTGFVKKLPDVIKSGVQIATTLGQSLMSEMPEIISSVGLAFSTLGTELYDNAIVPAWNFITGELPTLINDGISKLDLAEVGRTLSDGFKTIFGGVSTFLDSIDWENVGSTIADFMNGIDWAGVIASIFKTIGTVIKNTPDLLKGLAENLDAESQAVIVGSIFGKKLVSSIADTLVKSGSVKAGFTSIKNTLTTNISAGADAGGLSWATKFTAAAGAFLAGWSIGSAIYEKFGEEIDEYALHPFFESIEIGWGEYARIWEENAEKVKNGIDEIKDWGSSMGAAIGQMVGDAKDEVLNFVDNIRLFGESWVEVTEHIGERFNDFVTFIGNGVKSIHDGWTGFFEGIGEKTYDVIHGVMDDWRTGGLEIWKQIDKIKTKWNDWKNNWSVGVSTIKSGIENAKTYFSDLGTSISSVVNSAWNWGKDLVNNFINGVKSLGTEWVSFWEDFGGTIADYIGFSEPEKGELSNFHTFAPDMIDLFTKGIEDNAYKAQNAVNDMLGSLRTSFETPITANVNTIASAQSGGVAAGTAGRSGVITLVMVSEAGERIAQATAKPMDIINGNNVTFSQRRLADV